MTVIQLIQKHTVQYRAPLKLRLANTTLISKVFKGHLQAYSTTTVNIYINSIDSIESSTMDYKG